MAHIISIQSINDPALAVYARLTEAQRRSAAGGGSFIAESVKVIGTALSCGCRPISLLMETRQLNGVAGELLRLPALADVPVYTAEREVLCSLTGYALTRGVLCAMLRPEERSAEQICRNARRLAVLENITDDANVGAIFRSAAALGADGLLLTPGCCDPLTRRALRVSMGTVLQLPWARLGSRAEEWPQRGVELLHTHGFALAALALDEQSVGLRDAALRQEERLAFVLGTEGKGLDAETVAACDYTVRIPMSNGVDSLNVAAASAVAFWELFASR